MNMKARLIISGFFLFVLIGIGSFVSGGCVSFLNEFWFTSGALLLLLLALIDQPHFSKDSNVLVNAITAGVSLLLVSSEFRNGVFVVFCVTIAYLTVSSGFLMWERSKPLPNENKYIQIISKINREVGKPKALFSVFFLWGAINRFQIESNEFSILFLYWFAYMVINIPSIAPIINDRFEKKGNINQENALGKIFGVQSKNTFLVKLFQERNLITKRLGFVEFLYSMDEKPTVRKGLILDTYLLNEQLWIKVLTAKEINDIFGNKIFYENHTNDIVYRIEGDSATEYLNAFIGIVTEQSTIGKIRFIYTSTNEIMKGRLLEVKIGARTVYYQIIEGIAKTEQLENKNETGIIIGEAIQLGTWNQEKVRFEPFGWVPEINTPIYIASDIKKPECGENEIMIGRIPNTNFPVIINKVLALTHHTAIIGVTGSGKSVFSRNLIREYLNDEKVKVICVDFTGEYRNEFRELLSDDIVPHNNGNTNAMADSLKDFLENTDKRITIFELPELSNTTNGLNYIKQLFDALFTYAKSDKCFGHNVCVVLEEAHTIIPEWNFVGIADRSSQSLLNSIAQIALQGRKYGVGLLVIAQRTANVSKTILTQCNTVISFQEFDKTSSDFLCNYFGDDLVKMLPKLEFRQAIIAGKALKSTVPIIFEVPDGNEENEYVFEKKEIESTENNVQLTSE